MRVFSMALMRLDDCYVYGIAKRYYKHCTDRYCEIFFAWRHEIQKLMDEKYHDLTDGYSYPFLQNRVVESFG